MRCHSVYFKTHCLLYLTRSLLRSVFINFSLALLADVVIARFVYFAESGAGSMTVQMKARPGSPNNSAAGTLHLRCRRCCTDVMRCMAVEAYFPGMFSLSKSAL